MLEICWEWGWGWGVEQTGAGRVVTGAGRIEMCTDDSSGNCNEDAKHVANINSKN